MHEPVNRPLLAVNALALRPGGDAARTFLENVLRELPAAWPGRVVALVRHGVSVEAKGLEVRRVAVSSGLGRIVAERIVLPRLIRAVAPDVFLNPNESIPHSVDAPLVVVAQNLLFHCDGAGPLAGGSAAARARSRVQFAYYRAQMPRAYRRAAVVACVSAHARDVLAAHARLEPARATIVPCGADRLPVLQRHGSNGRRTLLAVGAIADYKRLDVAVRALALLPADYELALVGESWPGAWPGLVQLAQSLSVEGRVRRVGVASDEDLAALYARAHALVAPSACESFGIPVAEAMHAGVPVIAADEQWARELTAGAALLAEPEAAAFAGALWALEDDETRIRLSSAGVERARAFTWARTARGLAQAAQAALA